MLKRASRRSWWQLSAGSRAKQGGRHLLKLLDGELVAVEEIHLRGVEPVDQKLCDIDKRNDPDLGERSRDDARLGGQQYAQEDVLCQQEDLPTPNG
eukprot:1164113-Rhodomonas_salina.1